MKGQGGPVDSNGIPIPIVIKGSLDNPRIYPDIPGILENPEAILKGLRSFGNVGGSAADGIEKLNKNLGGNLQKQIDKQSEKLGIDINKLINQGTKTNGDQQNQQNQKEKPKTLEDQLFNNLTKGLFGN